MSALDEVVITGWTPKIPRELSQLMISAVKYDQLADTTDGSQRKRHFRRKAREMVRAYSRYPEWFLPPFREGHHVALCPVTGWPSSEGIRTKMHIPVQVIVTNSYYRSHFGSVIEGPSRRRRPQCVLGAKPWPHRLCPRARRQRRHQPYRNRRASLAAFPA